MRSFRYLPLVLITLIILFFSCNKTKIIKKNIDSGNSIEIKEHREKKKISAPEFSFPNQYGEIINLSDFKGNIILIDFWASWCPPCRKENPNIVRLYETYNPKGLEILSVSLDGFNDENAKQNWVSAIEDDGLIWTNVSELKGWNSKVVDLYNINSLPHTVLINKEGRIVSEKLLGEELEHEIKLLVE